MEKVSSLNFQKKSVIIYSNTLYQYQSGGTELFLRKIQTQYNKTEMDVITLIPTKKYFLSMFVNYIYVGIFSYKAIPSVLQYIEINKDCIIQGIVLCEMYNVEIKYLHTLLKSIDKPIIISVHDFSLICNTFLFRKDNGEFCGIGRPSGSKCVGCNKYHQAIVFSNALEKMYLSLRDKICKVVFPSEYCQDVWLSQYPFLSEKSVVRPHLNMNGIYQNQFTSKVLNIAYIGAQAPNKGFYEWNVLLQGCKGINGVRFHYFGTGSDKIECVKSHFVDNRLDSQMMLKELRKNNIQVAFLWSTLPETYSYTYYEASAAGLFCITGLNSGNIEKQIRQNKNGIVYHNIEELIADIKNGKLYNLAKSYINSENKFSPLFLNDNPDISPYTFPDVNLIAIKNGLSKFHRTVFLSRMYERIVLDSYGS